MSPVSEVTLEEIAAATLLGLPRMSTGRLRALLDHYDGPVAALRAVQAGRAGDALRGHPGRHAPATLARDWQARSDPTAVAGLLARRATHVWVAGRPRYPIPDEVPDRPPVLLAEGSDPAVLDRPRVAIVGTRAATPHGLADARELGAFLARAGVTVVSGMAIGIDGAAHEGALDADGGALAVVATGLDVEYPRRHVALYARVRRHGLVVGESPYGQRPIAARFPVRNRIIAALADVVVVVEATRSGGARITAQFALDYGRTVLAIPGSRRNPAAAGTNALIADGAHPLLECSDVLLALGLHAGSARGDLPTSGVPTSDVAARRAIVAPPPGPDASSVLHALGGEAATSDQLAGRTGFDPARLAVALDALERAGRVERAQGAIWPR